MTTARSPERSPQPAAAGAITLRELTVRYGSRGVLQKISLHIPAGEVTALIGPAGAGKTTLLRTINRMSLELDAAQAEGEIHLGQISLLGSSLSSQELRRRVGMVFAVPQPLPGSIRDNLLFGPRLHGQPLDAELASRIEECLRAAELWEEVRDRLAGSAWSLSGGQQQRLCLARALMLRPEVLLLDEPTSGLDPISTQRVEASLRALRGHATVVLVTNNVKQAERVSDHAAFLLQGELIESGATTALFHGARDARTRAYLKGEFG